MEQLEAEYAVRGKRKAAAAALEEAVEAAEADAAPAKAARQMDLGLSDDDNGIADGPLSDFSELLSDEDEPSDSDKPSDSDPEGSD